MRSLMLAAGLLGATAVAMAARVAHGMDGALAAFLSPIVTIHLVHAAALLGCAPLAARSRLVLLAGGLLASGTVLFAGAIYLQALAGIRLPMVAPAGGLLLIGGWLAVAAAAFRLR